jgi:hypothetical protein
VDTEAVWREAERLLGDPVSPSVVSEARVSKVHTRARFVCALSIQRLQGRRWRLRRTWANGYRNSIFSRFRNDRIPCGCHIGHHKGLSVWEREPRKGVLRQAPGHQAWLAQEQSSAGPNLLVARTAAGQDGLNSFSVFLTDARSDFQRAKSREFSVTSVAPVCSASDAISRSRKWLAKSTCPNVLRERRSRMPASIQAEPEGEEKWPSGSLLRTRSTDF